MNTLARSDRPFTAVDRQIADRLSSYWVNFIKTGDPNGRSLPAWPAVARDRALTMEVGDKNAAIPVAGSPAKQAFFEKFFLRQRPAGTR
jgi:carboxylesterase type B